MDDKRKKQGSFYKALATALPLVLLVSPTVALSEDFVSLDDVSLDYKDFFAGGYDPLVTGSGLSGRSMGKEIELRVNTTFADSFFFNNRVHSMTDEVLEGYEGAGQFRTVGWQFQVGLRVSKALDVYYEHHSQHILDAPGTQHFPVNDSIGMKLIIFSKGRREALIPW